MKACARKRKGRAGGGKGKGEGAEPGAEQKALRGPAVREAVLCQLH